MACPKRKITTQRRKAKKYYNAILTNNYVYCTTCMKYKQSNNIKCNKCI